VFSPALTGIHHACRNGDQGMSAAPSAHSASSASPDSAGHSAAVCDPPLTVKSTSSERAFAPAVLGGPDKLSSAARAEIQKLSGNRPGRWLLEAAINWIAIALAIWVGVAASNLFVTLLCIVFIGVRQMVFGLLLHDQVHRLGLRGK
jgi:hypothetical protein